MVLLVLFIVISQHFTERRREMRYPRETGLVFTPLGGVGEIGRNSFCFIDPITGMAFGIDAGEKIVREEYKYRHGREVVIPDVELFNGVSLEKVIFWFISHAHLDHCNPEAIGAISSMVGKDEKSPVPILLSETALFSLEKVIARRAKDARDSAVENRRDPRQASRDVWEKLTPFNCKKKWDPTENAFVYERPEKDRIINVRNHYQVGNLNVLAFLVNHSTRGTYGFCIEGNNKRAVFLPDCKLNGYEPEDRKRMEWILRKIRSRGPVDLVIMDTLGAEFSGEVSSETVVVENVEEILKDCLNRGKRCFVSFFSSNLERMSHFYEVVKRLTDAPPGFLGGSMINYAMFNGFISDAKSNQEYLKKAQVIFCTGSQAEQGMTELGRETKAALVRLLDPPKKEGGITLGKNDVVILSSRAIPGTKDNPGSEKALCVLVCDMAARGIEVYLNEGEKEKLMLSDGIENVFERQIHVSGHERADGKRRILELLGPNGSETTMRVVPYHAELPVMLKMEDLLPDGAELVILENGETLEV